ncbi:unnamed protein product [Calypogeia fissa]
MREYNPRYPPNSSPLRLQVAAKTQSLNNHTTKKVVSMPKVQQHRQQNSVSQGGDACRSKLNTRKTSSNSLIECQPPPTRLHENPYDSSSESDSITGDRNPSLHTMAPTNVVRRSRYETSMRKKVVLNKNGEETIKRKEIVKTLGMEVSESQERVRASGLNLRGGDRKPSITQSDELCDSSLEDSACSSEKLSSEKKTGWTWTCSTCTETESQQMDVSPPERPSKKCCGVRDCSLQASREVPTVWNSVERTSSKSSYHHANGRLGESKECQIVYQTGCGMKGEDKDEEDCHCSVPKDQASLQERYKNEIQRKDTNKFCVVESGRQSHAKSVLEISTKIIGQEQFHAEIAWIASAGSRGAQRALEKNNKNHESIKLKIEKLQDEVPHGCNGIRTKEHGCHNKLREAFEAVWKTSLGSKGKVENQDMEKEVLEHEYWDLQNEESLKVPSLTEETPHEKLEEKGLAEGDVDDKISAYKKAWKAALGTNKTSEDNCLGKELSSPVFWCIQRDHGNLDALLDREGLHDQNDLTTTQVPVIEGRARGVAVHKSTLHEASVKAGEAICIPIHDQPGCTSTYEEEVEDAGVSLKNPKLVAEDSGNRDARKSFLQTLAKDKRANESAQKEPGMKTGSRPSKARLKLMAESESRISAEAKASYFEACAKAAEKRLHSLLDERNWYYKKFVEEVEYNSDMKRLQHLMELEKAHQTRQEQPQRKKVDVRLLVASSVADEVLNEENEDGHLALQSSKEGPDSHQSNQGELLQVDTCDECDRLEFEKWQQEIGKTMSETEFSTHDLTCKTNKTQKESIDAKKDEGINEDVCIPAEGTCTPVKPTPRHEGRDTRQEQVTEKNINGKNEKKRPLSPINQLQDWDPQELTKFGKIELGCKTNQTPNKSHGFSQDSKLVAKASGELEESGVSSVLKSSDSPLYNCAELPVASSCKLVPLPAKWKKKTKAELQRIMQEQELTWKMAETAMDELGRRLEVLENYKTNLQETVRRSKAMRNVDGLLSQLEKKVDDHPGGFSMLYNCPVFEQESKLGTHPSQESSCSQTPNEENGAYNATPIVDNGANSGPGQVGYLEGCGQESSHIEAGNKKSDEGHLRATDAFKQLFDIVLEQEAKFENLNGEIRAPLGSTESRACYMDLLKRLSQQLAELCHDLCEDTPSQQVQESLDKTNLPTTNVVTIEVESEHTAEEPKTKGVMTCNNSRKTQQSHEIAKVLTQGCSAKSVKLRAALEVAERRLKEELKNNSLLAEKIECQVQHISEIKAKNALELKEKDQKLSFETQVNKNLAHDMATTETTLADLRSQNKEQVGGLDSQLQAARSEVTTLRDTEQALKIDLERKETVASNLKGERNKNEQQIQVLRSQMQAFQSETDAMVGEKSELLNSIQQTRIEADEQQNRIKEFISINEDLIAVAQSKENEIKTLTKIIATLQQSIKDKSEEAIRLLGQNSRLPEDVIKFKEEGQTYHHHHEFLQSKLRETEQELLSWEEAMERLTFHLGRTIEGQHFILEEKEQLLLSLNNAKSKEWKLENEVQHLKTIIQDLEEKINRMDAERTRIKTELENIKTRRQNALAIEQQAQVLKNRLHQLEEEIMEKEGQISILTSKPI